MNRLLKKSIYCVIFVARHCGVPPKVRLIPRSLMPCIWSFLNSLKKHEGFSIDCEGFTRRLLFLCSYYFIDTIMCLHYNYTTFVSWRNI